MAYWIVKTRLRTALVLFAMLVIPSEIVTWLSTDDLSWKAIVGYAWVATAFGIVLTLILAWIADRKDSREKQDISN
jgi:uncharacterized membrane protein